MGCWGITAFESDTGLDAVSDIRNNLPDSGEMNLGEWIAFLKDDEWYTPPVEDAHSHTGMMALAEIMIKYIDRDFSRLDWDEDSKQFSDIHSFTAAKQDIQWLRDYLSDTLQNAIETEKSAAENGYQYGDKWNGWVEEKYWIGWQEHMTTLLQRLDTLLSSPEDQIELVANQEQEENMGMSEINM